MFLAPLCTHSGSKYSLAYGSADCQHTDRGMQVGTQAAPRPWKEWPRAAQCTASALGVLALLAGLCLLSRLRLMMGSASSAPSGAMVVLARRRGQPAASGGQPHRNPAGAPEPGPCPVRIRARSAGCSPRLDRERGGGSSVPRSSLTSKCARRRSRPAAP